ncbi:MAG TPA: hypothetical protein VK151_12160 [Fluviicola sp.]|nr:hypothetical protein [Fluviicola sp.]
MFLIRKIGIVFVVAGILSTTGILHFAKNLPDMIAHYEHHNKEHEKVGFFDFLTDHFNNPDHHKDQHPGHNDFPFHHDHSSTCCASILTFIPAEHLTFDIRFAQFDVPESIKINAYRQFSPSEFASAIWQPPQV